MKLCGGSPRGEPPFGADGCQVRQRSGNAVEKARLGVRKDCEAQDVGLPLLTCNRSVHGKKARGYQRSTNFRRRAAD